MGGRVHHEQRDEGMGKEIDDKKSDTMRIDIPPEEDSLRERKVFVRRDSPEMASLGGPAFQQLLRNIYDAVLVSDIDGQILNANERALTFFKCEKAYLCVRSIVDIFSGADDGLIPTILENLEQDRFTLIQATCIRRDNSLFPAEVSANRINLSGEECISFFVRDVTLRQAREEQLRTGYNVIQNAGGGIAITDTECELTYGNPALRKMLGVVEDGDIAGRDIRQCFRKKDIDEILIHLETNELWSGELRIIGCPGKDSWVQASIVKNINTEGMLNGYIFSFQDISREREAKLKLEAYTDELSRKNREMEMDIEMARDVQQALLPRKYPFCGADGEKKRLDFEHIYIPSGVVGGDFFDVIKLSESQVGLFMADVSGHGMRAALVTAALRGIIEDIAFCANDTGEFISKVNAEYSSIFSVTEDFSFVTAVYAVLDTTTGMMSFSIAGHPDPIIIRPSGETALIKLEQDVPTPAIGITGELELPFASFEFQMLPGDVLFLYTDGIFEEECADREEYGLQRLETKLVQLADKPLADILDGIVSDVRAVTGKSEFVDDVCMLAVSYLDGDGE